MRITFHGGAGMVTGANYLVESKNARVLIDCGLHQGSRYCEHLNFEPFPYDPASIDAVFVTHAHIDHIGRLPQLYRAGFRGAIYSTPPTKDFAEHLLIDSEHILDEEARSFNLPPLYTLADINETLTLWKKTHYHQPVTLRDLTITFFDAGHILGSAFIMVSDGEKRVAFSGDLGNIATPIVKDTEQAPNADYALIESTYGGRIHEDLSTRKDVLEDAIEAVAKTKSVLLIPAFAMERTQDLLFEINELVENHRIPRVPVFIDSPLAIKLTAVYKKYSADPAYVDKEALSLLRRGDAIFDFPGLTLTLTTEQSKAIGDVPPPKIIIAGSGMSHGGRILHHEQRYLSGPNNILLMIGYQAQGSLGRRLLDGAKNARIFGEDIPVRCRVIAIGGYSAHADQAKLLQWLRPIKDSLKRVFVVQGEPDQSAALAEKIRDLLAVDVHIPRSGEQVVL